MITKIKSKLAIAAMIGSVLVGGSAAFASSASSPAGGSIQLFVTPGRGAVSPILITGAIGDYGQATSINKNGKTDPNGNYVRVSLRKGTFEVNSTALNAKLDHAQPNIDRATCSVWVSEGGRVSLFDGEGLYAGISAKPTITETYALILPRFTSGSKKGQCNLGNNAKPLRQYVSLTGRGTVKFS